MAGGNVTVVAHDASHAAITAQSEDAVDNTSSVAIDADGTVLVTDVSGNVGTAEISAIAKDADNSNNADVGINANNVLVLAAEYGYANIKAEAANILCSDVISRPKTVSGYLFEKGFCHLHQQIIIPI